MKVIAHTSYLDYNKSPCDYTKIVVEAELKTIHFSTKRARIVFDNPSKPGRKETNDIPLKNIELASIAGITVEIHKLIKE